MRSLVTVVLVLCGTLLFITPAISDYLARRQLMSLMLAKAEFSQMSLGGRMESGERNILWLAGAGMVIVAVVLAVRRPAQRVNPA